MTVERMLWCVLIGGACGLASGLYHSYKDRKARKKSKSNVKKIFVCSPFTADSIEGIRINVARAREVAYRIATRFDIPIAPHIYCTQFLNDTDTYERWLGMHIGYDLLRQCDELWVIGKEISEGMGKEIIHAVDNKIPVRCYKFEGGPLTEDKDLEIRLKDLTSDGARTITIKGSKVSESVD